MLQQVEKFSLHLNTNVRFCPKAFVIRNTASNIPSATIPTHIVTNFIDLLLTDLLFFKSSPLDILIGLNVFFAMLKGDIINAYLQ